MPSHGQLGQLRGQSDSLGRHDPRTIGGAGEGDPTKEEKKQRKYKYEDKETALAARRTRRNRARKERRRRARKHLMAAGRVTWLGLVPRVHTSSLVPSPRRGALSFALRCAHSRLLSAPWVGHRAASRCRRLQDGRLVRGVRGIVGCRARYERVKRFVNRTSTRRAADATRDTQSEENRNSQRQKEQ